MTERINDRLDLLLLSLDAHKAEYLEHSDNWKNLETKAQGAVAIAGIFLAVLFSWVHDIPQNYSCLEYFLLIASIVLLVSSVICAILGLKIRKVCFPPIGSMDGDITIDILSIEDKKEFKERIPAFLNDQIHVWDETNKDIQNNNERKAKYIEVSQITIMAAACVVALLSIIAVIL